MACVGGPQQSTFWPDGSRGRLCVLPETLGRSALATKDLFEVGVLNVLLDDRVAHHLYYIGPRSSIYMYCCMARIKGQVLIQYCSTTSSS